VKYVTFGSTGQRVSRMCLGTMMFGRRCDEAEAARIMDLAIERGVDNVDTAASYADGQTEEIVGRLLKGRRDRVFLGTKVTRTTDASWIKKSLDESLARLQVDHVDLFMIHWPRTRMKIEPMMEALDGAVRAGKTRFVGCSNFPAWLLAHCNAAAERNGWVKLVCNQVNYSAAVRGVEVEVLPQALAEDIAITTYSPMMGGVLAGRYKVGEPIPTNSRGSGDARMRARIQKLSERLPRYEALAAEIGLPPGQLALAWVNHSPAVTSPIVGCSTRAQVEETIPAFDVELSDEQYAAVNAVFEDEPPEQTDANNFPRLRTAFDLIDGAPARVPANV
jgi:aryl-alcohol dehydrogenase-like predicted oxidoreductase